MLVMLYKTPSAYIPRPRISRVTNVQRGRKPLLPGSWLTDKPGMCPGSGPRAHCPLITPSERAHLPSFSLSQSLVCFLYSNYLQVYTITPLPHYVLSDPSARLQDFYGKVFTEPLHPQLPAQCVTQQMLSKCFLNVDSWSSWTRSASYWI